MQSSTHLITQSQKKSPAEKKKGPGTQQKPVKKKKEHDAQLKTFDVTLAKPISPPQLYDLAHKDHYILLSYPYGAKCKDQYEDIPDPFCLMAILRMLESLQMKLQIDDEKMRQKHSIPQPPDTLALGKIRCIVGASLIHNDYFLKCPQEFSRFKPLLQQHREEFASLAEEKGSTKKIAGKMADIMQFAAVEKERDKVKEYNDYLKTKNFDLDCEVIGFSAIKKFAQYKKQADLAQEKLSNPESTLNKDIYDSARDYIRTKCSTKNEKLKADDKLTPIEGSEMHYLVSELQAIFPELNIDWVQVLIEGSALYLKEEFPVISMIQQSRDFIEYGSSIVLNMFKSAVDKDRYLQYKWELINKSIRGQSDPFSIQGDTVQEVELKKTKPPEPEPDIRPMQIIKGPDIKISNDFSPFIEVNSEGKKLKYSPHHLFKPAETQVDVSNPLQNTPALQF